ncbi:MAG TPA: CoA ester lyase [Sphingomicrobium sp.]|nr:CoA ester lyase [Sphingomicrobium sp.]
MTVAEAKNDKALDLFAIRSVLFLPASNPRAIAKARESGADLVVLDLEDAVKPEDKGVARKAALGAVATGWSMPVAIRVNGVGTEWHSLDLDCAANSNADLVVVPRASSAHLVSDLGETVNRPVLAMIETAAGVLSAPEIARSCAGLIAGTNDLRSDLRLPLYSGREPIATSLQLIVLAARAAGVPVFDGVFNNLEDINAFTQEAEEGRALGFDGKSLIHPNQIAACHRAFSPSPEELARARKLVAAFQGGAERLGNEMIERMHVEAAQRILDRARI